MPDSKNSKVVLVGLGTCVGGCGEVEPRMYVPLVPGVISTMVTVRQTVESPPCLPHLMTKTTEYLCKPCYLPCLCTLDATHYIYALFRQAVSSSGQPLHTYLGHTHHNIRVYMGF